MEQHWLTMFPQLTRCVACYTALAVLLTVVAFAFDMGASTVTGLHRTVYEGRGLLGRLLLEDVAPDLTLDFIDATPDLPERLHVVWRGMWFLPETRDIRLWARGDGRVTVWVNGLRLLSGRLRETPLSTVQQITLAAGFHPLTVEYEGRAYDHDLDVYEYDFVPYRLFRSRTGLVGVWLARAAAWTGAVAMVLWLTPVIIAFPVAIVVGVLFAGKPAFQHQAARPSRYRRFVTAARSALSSVWRRSGEPLSRGGPSRRFPACYVEKASIEKVLCKALPFVFVAFFAGGVVDMVQAYRTHNRYIMGEWLINYQGGFVRRGLLGEVIYELCQFTDVNPGIYVLLLQILVYLVFLCFSYLLLRKKNLLPYAPLVFAPFMFMYWEDAGFRKDVIFLALMAFSVWLAQSANGRRTDLAFMAILGLYPLIVLSHEMLFAFLPYLLAAYALLNRRTPPRQVAGIVSLACLSAFCFSSVLLYGRPAAGVTDQIYHSLRLANYPIEVGAISFLDWSTSFAYTYVMEQFLRYNYSRYVIVVALCVLGFFSMRERCGRLARNRVCLSLIVSAVALTVPVFVVAIDWGRLIRIHAVALFLLSLGSDTESEERRVDGGAQSGTVRVPAFRAAFWTIALLSYISVWRIPLLGEGSIFVSEPNYISSVRRFVEVVKSWL